MPGKHLAVHWTGVHAKDACRPKLPCCFVTLSLSRARQVVDTDDMWVRKLEELVQRGVIPHPRTLGK